MRIDVITLFPDMFKGPLTESILQRASDDNLIDIKFHDLREYGIGKYRQVDDKPYGGGAGMLFRVDVVIDAIEGVTEKCKMQNAEYKIQNTCLPDRQMKCNIPHRVYLSPRGKRLTQTRVESIAKKHGWLILLCGHYEGIDQRIIDGGWIDEEISIGDYVLTGGEIPAMVLIDAVARQIPGVLGKDESVQEESFSKALDRKKEYPHYTRPDEFRGLNVPDVLREGHHAKIEEWRKKNIK